MNYADSCEALCSTQQLLNIACNSSLRYGNMSFNHSMVLPERPSQPNLPGVPDSPLAPGSAPSESPGSPIETNRMSFISL